MILSVLAAIILANGATEPAQDSQAAPTHPPITAMRVTAPITVDGVLSEAIWQNGHAVTKFHQRDPFVGEPTEKTEVRVAYDDGALYIGARMYDSKPDSIIARLTRRDNYVPADDFTLYIDPFHDKRSGYYFVINAAGVLRDGTLFNDGWDDSSWDGVWIGKAQVDEQGWSAEMRIPFSQVRGQSGDEVTWGVNFRRQITRRSEGDYVVYQPRSASGFVSRFPDLVGIKNVASGRSIQVLPYVTSKGEYLQHDFDDPFNDGSRYNADVGADIRMGIGKSLTLNASINPDFGQVEVDPAVVNLSDVETFFDEKRPFFVEGADVFNFGQQGANSYWGFNWHNPTFFYTRRIGRSPQGEAPDAEFVDLPNGTTILGAGKLTGRIGGFNIGTLHSLTARESAKLHDAGSRWKSEVEPLAYYGVARAQKEFNDRRQGIGFLSTLASRSFEDDLLRDYVNDRSLMLGLDGWTFLDQDKVWVISGWAAMSRVEGNNQRMTDLQRSSRRYFQRPDAGHVSVDSLATSMSGHGARLWINKEKGNVFFNSAIGYMNPDFEVNDMGFQTRADQINAHIGSGYKWTGNGKWKKYADVSGALFGTKDFDGNTIVKGLWLNSYTEFNNNFSWSRWGGLWPERDDNRRTRGGPLMRNPAGWELGTYFDTDGKSKLFYFFDLGTEGDDGGSQTTWFSPGIEIKPASNITLRIGPDLTWRHDDAQYVDTYDDATASATFAQRYVFAELDQMTVAASLRLNWSFTPTLSLQTYIQPLVSTGEYGNFKELARPRSYAFNVYGQNGSTYNSSTGEVDPDGPLGPAQPFTIDSPDFNFKSLRGNAVLRWEYMPGSTFFLVWTQQRIDDAGPGRFSFDRDYNRLFDAQPDNIFLAKVSYYFNL